MAFQVISRSGGPAFGPQTDFTEARQQIYAMSGQIPIPMAPQSTDNRRNDGNPIWRNTIHVPKVIVAIPNMPASKYRFADSVSIRQSSGENVRHAAKIEKIIETNPPDTTTEDIFSSADQDSGKNLMGLTPGFQLSQSLSRCRLNDTAHLVSCQLFPELAPNLRIEEPCRVALQQGRFLVEDISGATILICADKDSAAHYVTLLRAAYRAGFKAGYRQVGV
jgi:hypothetical protein